MKIDGGGHDRDEDGDDHVLSRPAKRQTTLVSEIITRGTTLLHPSNLFLRFLPRFIRPHLLFYPQSRDHIVPPSPSFSPCSSTLVLPAMHDVFVSFRGIDVRDTFLSHLNSFLKHHKKLAVYKDDSDLERGEEISPSLLEAVERSACYVVIFSPNYADSPWCLDELVWILDCSQRYGRRVVPVFYGGVDPSHVENQTASYRKLPMREAVGKIRSWRAALSKASAISGFDSRVTRPESKLIEEISRAVLQAVSGQMVPVSYSNNGGLVGLERRMNHIEQWATSGIKNLTIGLWGAVGIGKTTLAKAIYDKFSGQFETSYFLSNLSDKSSVSSQLRDGLQNDILSALLGDENAGRMTRDLKEHRLGRTRALVVIDDVGDDVGDIGHLNDLFKGRYCDLFARSIIILTSRNKQVLKNVCHHVYEVVALDSNEALQLFCFRAFREHCPPPVEYEGMSKRAITYAEGNPLALTTLGSHLYGRDQKFWGIELKSLERYPNQAIDRVVRRSYDGLHQVERNVFIDIACLYGRFWIYAKELKRLFDGNYVEHGRTENLIINFIDKSVLTIDGIFGNAFVKMHGLLSDLGRSIVNDELRLEKRSWLFEAQDVYSFFKQGKVSEVIRGIRWNESSGEIGAEGTINMQHDAFVKLENLRYLMIRQSEIKFVFPKDGLRCLPNSLIILCWDSFPMRCLPYEFSMENLTYLSLRSSNLERLWDDSHNVDLRNLTLLDLSRSMYLKKLPDLSTAERLEQIDLSFCVDLVELPRSIFYLPKLEFLRLYECTRLELNALGYYPDVNRDDGTAAIFPKLIYLSLSGTSIQNKKLEGCREISADDQEVVHFCDLIFQSSKGLRCIHLHHCIRLEELPEILVPMEALAALMLDSCTSLSRLPESISNMVQLKQLSLSRTAIQELPATIGDLACLEQLVLRFCTSLKHLCDTIHKLSKLDHLELSGCSQLSHLPELPSSLTWLDAYGCTALQTMSTSGLSKHNFLMCEWNFGNCGKLDSEVCNMLFKKFTQDASSRRTKKYVRHRWLVLPRGWNSLDGWRPSEPNSVVTATLGRLWQLKGLIYCASFSSKGGHRMTTFRSLVDFSIGCHKLSSPNSEFVVAASSCEGIPTFGEDQGSNLLVWYDSEVSWIRNVSVPLDSSSGGQEISVMAGDATIKFVFRAMRRYYDKQVRGYVDVPVMVKNCGVIPIYDNMMIVDDDDT